MNFIAHIAELEDHLAGRQYPDIGHTTFMPFE